MKVEPITLVFNQGKYDEKEYVIEYSRDTCIQAETAGFSAEKVEANPMSQIPLLFFYGLKMHHPKMTRAESDKILFDDIGGITKELAERLVELYAAPYETLFNETGTPKNPNLTVRL